MNSDPQMLILCIIGFILSIIYLWHLNANKEFTDIFSFKLGSYKITAINDGKLDNNLDSMRYVDGTIPNVNEKICLTRSVNIFLIDTGYGDFEPAAGHLLKRLESAGYNPSDITAVLLTHLHIGHIGGLIHNEQKSFPNATVYVAQKELDFWLSSLQEEIASLDNKAAFSMVRKILNPYRETQKLSTFTIEDTILGLITVFDALGHTPGHSLFLIESDTISYKNHKQPIKECILFIGDTFNYPDIQLSNPKIGSSSDIDLAVAIQVRKNIFELVSKMEVIIAAAHMPFPGVGYIRSKIFSNRYYWVLYKPTLHEYIMSLLDFLG